MKEKTKVELELEARIAACKGDEERVEVLRRALRFKSSWVELAEALTSILKLQSWRDWGYGDFHEYCKRELHLREETVQKLTGSYGFLAERAPAVFQRSDSYGSMPSIESIDFWRRAEDNVRERGELDAQAPQLDDLRRAVLDDGVSPQALKRRFGEQFFPMSDEEQEDRDRAAVLAAAKRLLNLLQSVKVVPRAMAKNVAAELEGMVDELEARAVQEGKAQRAS